MLEYETDTSDTTLLMYNVTMFVGICDQAIFLAFLHNVDEIYNVYSTLQLLISQKTFSYEMNANPSILSTISQNLTAIRNKRYFEIATASGLFQGIKVTLQNISNGWIKF